jgi:hypothetical protein
MHTPYIRPSENGSRGHVYWVQLNSGRYRIKNRKSINARCDSRNVSGRMEVMPQATPVNKIWRNVESDNSSDSACNDCSVTIRCSKLFNFSIQEFASEALSISSHSSALDNYALRYNASKLKASDSFRHSKDTDTDSSRKVEGLCLNIDPFLMGIGGDDSWSACVHEEYLLPPEAYNFKVSLSFHYQ